jgi:hypothetical protein
MQSYDEIAMQSLDFADLTPPSNFLNEFTGFTKTVKLDPWAAEIRGKNTSLYYVITSMAFVQNNRVKHSSSSQLRK